MELTGRLVENRAVSLARPRRPGNLPACNREHHMNDPEIRIPALLLVVWCLLPAESRAESPAKRIDFNRDIRPILSNNCYPCHGPDEKKRKADLRLDLRDGLYSDHDGARPVVGGKPGESELYKRITAQKSRERMPPPKSKLALYLKRLPRAAL